MRSERATMKNPETMMRDDLRMMHLLSNIEGTVYPVLAACRQKSPLGTILPEGLIQQVLTIEDVCLCQSPM